MSDARDQVWRALPARDAVNIASMLDLSDGEIDAHAGSPRPDGHPSLARCCNAALKSNPLHRRTQRIHDRLQAADRRHCWLHGSMGFAAAERRLDLQFVDR
jgi:hypothetical protein